VRVCALLPAFGGARKAAESGGHFFLAFVVRAALTRRARRAHTLQLPLSEFRERLAAESSLPAAQQRLIFRGRVLPDTSPTGEPLTLASLDIQDGHTLHLVTRAPAVAASLAAGVAPRNGARALQALGLCCPCHDALRCKTAPHPAHADACICSRARRRAAAGAAGAADREPRGAPARASATLYCLRALD
jgi:hypothetical protein